MADFQMRIEDKRSGSVLLMQPIEQMVQQGGLAGSDFAGEQEQAFAGLDPMGQPVERFARLTGEKQVTRIGVDVKGVFAQRKKLVVHVRVACPVPVSRLP